LHRIGGDLPLGILSQQHIAALDELTGHASSFIQETAWIVA
jgi:hypothetical protein